MESNAVLIVDNDPSYREQLKGLFSSHGVDVHTAEDSRTSMKTLDTLRPSLIVLSAELPTLSGYTVCRKLKRDERFRDIPLVMISAQATDEIFAQHRKLKTRAEGYFIKPFDLDAFWQSASTYLGQRTLGEDDAPDSLDAVDLARPGEDLESDNTILARSGNAPPSSTSWQAAKAGWVKTRTTNAASVEPQRLQRALAKAGEELTQVKAELTESQNQIEALEKKLAEREAELEGAQEKLGKLEATEEALQELQTEYENLEDLYIDQLESKD